MASAKRNAGTALAISAGAVALGTVAAKRRGYTIGRNAVVRCRKGHLFTTIWIPGVSFKAVRLGFKRVQRCPVGPHWSVVSLVREADLTDAERVQAHALHDVRIP